MELPVINRALLRKCIGEAKWLLLGSTAVVIAFCWLRIWLVSRLETDRFQRILDNLPDTWMRFLSVDIKWLVTYAGRISSTYEEPIVVFAVCIWAIARGSDVISGELGRGTMEMLLAQPVSRLKVMFTQAGVTLAGVAVLASASWLGIYFGLHTNRVKEEVTPSIRLPFRIPLLGEDVSLPFAKPQERITPMHELVDARVFVPAAVNLFSLGVFMAGLSTLASSWDRYRWRTIGFVVGVFVVSAIVKFVGRGADIAWLTYSSVLSAYDPQRIVEMSDKAPQTTWSVLVFEETGALTALGPLGYDLVLILLGALCYLAAAVIFTRRDLPAPL